VLPPVSVAASNPAEDSTDGAGKPVTFKAENLVDGDPTTAWRTAGNGMGASITLQWAEPVKIQRVGLIPGYAQLDDQGYNRFKENRRVLQAKFVAAGSTKTVDFKDAPDMQFQPFDVTTQNLRIEILATTTDTPKRDFTAVSEVLVLAPPGAKQE